jgi:predicted metal-binding membrane protein
MAKALISLIPFRAIIPQTVSQSTRRRTMAATAHQSLTHLSAAGAGVGHVAARPKLVALSCVILLAALGWLYLGVLVAGTSYSAIDRALIEALCRPSFGRTNSVATLALDIVLVFPMWCAMVLAMMLPTAAPMVLTYAELADTAARKGERAVSPLILVAGYTTIWLGFALVATVLQVMLIRTALLDAALASASPLFSGAILLGAGLYQFSALKQACLTHCRRPFPFFLANWSSEPREIFRLGLLQGVYCLGCCWAAMMVMFAIGAMNVVWMASLGVVMTAEKAAPTTWISRAAGVVLIVVGMAFVAAAVVHWPAWAQ